MTVLSALDSAGRRRSPATMPGYHAGRPPRNKGMRYPADPPTVEEIVAVMRQAADDHHGWRLRAMIVVLWRAGLRVQEALALAEHDLDPRRGSVLVRNGKGGRRREVGMDEWGWEHLRPWLNARAELSSGPCSASSTAPPAGERGQAPRSAGRSRLVLRNQANDRQRSRGRSLSPRRASSAPPRRRFLSDRGMALSEGGSRRFVAEAIAFAAVVRCTDESLREAWGPGRARGGAV
jgi:integrase